MGNEATHVTPFFMRAMRPMEAHGSPWKPMEAHGVMVGNARGTCANRCAW